MSTQRTSQEEFQGMWARQQPFWHAVYSVVWGAALVVTVLQPGPRGWVRPVALLLVMAIAYAVLGRRALVQQSVRWAVAYHLLSWSALLAIQVLDEGTETWILFFALFPQLWAMLPTRAAAAATFVVLVAFQEVRWAQTGYAPARLVEVFVGGIISIGLSLSLGLFINRIVGEAGSRAETIDELRATQAALAAVERDRGVQDERERISREIHDTLAQGFTSVITLARAADAALARGDATAARERLDLVDRTAVDNLAEARLIVAELTPGNLQSRTLVEALERLGAAMSHEIGLRAAVRVEGEPEPLGGAAEVVILRTAQEALSNVRRHADARSVDLALVYGPGRVVLTVSDDGNGFDTGEARVGFGLDGLHSRAAEVGGTVLVDSRPGGGTTLRLEVPR
ncbi:MAG: sensor histidine kinase [Ornithinibacter sp.]